MNYKPAEFKLRSFNCPMCNAFSNMKWFTLHRPGGGSTLYWEAKCDCCNNNSLWRQGNPGIDSAEMLFPDNGSSPIPEKDMPTTIKVDYQEAAKIISRSPRGAAALLRLALQKLCKDLGEKAKISTMI